MGASELAEGRGPVEVPEGCRRASPYALPGAARGDGAGRLFTSQGEIDGAIFRHPPEVVLLARPIARPDLQAVPLLALRTDPDEREALLSIGHPFFAPRAGRDRIGVLLTNDTDGEEIRELGPRATGSSHRRSSSRCSTSTRRSDGGRLGDAVGLSPIAQGDGCGRRLEPLCLGTHHESSCVESDTWAIVAPKRL